MPERLRKYLKGLIRWEELWGDLSDLILRPLNDTLSRKGQRGISPEEEGR